MFNFLHSLIKWGDSGDGTDELTWPDLMPVIEVSHDLAHPNTEEVLGYIGYDQANGAGIAVVEESDWIVDGLAWVPNRVIEQLSQDNDTRGVPIEYVAFRRGERTFQPEQGDLFVYPLEAFMPPYSERHVAESTHGDDPEAGVPLDAASHFPNHSVRD